MAISPNSYSHRCRIRSRDRLVYLDATDPAQPYGYNPLRRVRPNKIPLAASGLLETMRKLWPDAWGVRMEHVLRNCLYALLERDGSTLPDILSMLVQRISGSTSLHGSRIRWFGTSGGRSSSSGPSALKAEAVSPIQNKLGAMLADPLLHRVLVAPAVDLHFRQLMDEERYPPREPLERRDRRRQPRISWGASSSPPSGLLPSVGLMCRERPPAVLPLRRRISELHYPVARLDALRTPEVRPRDDARPPIPSPARARDPQRGARERRHRHLLSCRRGGRAVSLRANFQPTFGEEDLINLPNAPFLYPPHDRRALRAGPSAES